jgi:hypothetical protein
LSLSVGEACERYGLSPAEFLAWKTAFRRHGMAGLRATRTLQMQRR